MNTGNHNTLILGVSFSLVLHLLGFGFLNTFSKSSDTQLQQHQSSCYV